MNSIMERWVQTCRRELLDRTLVWNQHHLLHALREFERFYNGHRPPSGHRQCPPTPAAASADHRPGPDRPPGHKKTPTPGRDPPRIRACRLTCTDEVFGKRSVRNPAPIILICAPDLRCRHALVAVHIGGSACGYQAIFVSSTALASPGYDGQPAVYLYIAVL